MDEIKSKLSLQLLKAVSPILKSKSEKVNILTNKDVLLLLKDKNPHYDFFFRVEKEESEDGKPILVSYTLKRFSDSQKDSKSTRSVLDQFIKKLDAWLECIENYKRENLIDNSREHQYQKEFYEDFEIVDEDAKINGFTFPQQILLLNYIESIEEYIKNEKVELSIEEKTEILEETQFLKKQVGSETKDNYMKKQTAWWAKIRGYSIKVCEFTVKEFGKAVIKIAAEKGIAISWHSLPYYLDQIKTLTNF
jgi:hypothetical protein